MKLEKSQHEAFAKFFESPLKNYYQFDENMIGSKKLSIQKELDTLTNSVLKRTT